jgi:hypothetical protein
MHIFWWSMVIEGALAVGLMLLARAAPEGFEDASGFHYVRRSSHERVAASGADLTPADCGGTQR